MIPPESNLIGREVTGVQLFKREGVRLVDVVRGDASLRRNLADVVLQLGDRVVLRTEMTELLSLQRNKSLKRVDQVSSVETSTVEVLITPGCRMVGRSLGSLRLRRRFGVYTLAVHRRDQNIGRQLDDLVVRVGDTLLIEGAPEDIQRLANEMDMVDISKPSARAYRRTHAPLAILALIAHCWACGVWGGSDFLAGDFVGRLCPCDPLYRRRRSIFLCRWAIAGSYLFDVGNWGRATASGAVSLIVEAVAPYLAGLPPFFIIWAIYLLTSVLTELVSNNAVAVVVTPIAIGLATALGLDPRALVVAVMVAASASFATPIGYQTNMLVYGPGGYRFTDFMRVGIPLNLSIGLLASAVIPMIWAL